MKWLATFCGAACFALAAVLASIPVASECSTPHGIGEWPEAVMFGGYALAGAYIFGFGSRAQRLFLFGASVLITAGYIVGLSLSLPMVYQTEASCAAQGAR